MRIESIVEIPGEIRSWQAVNVLNIAAAVPIINVMLFVITLVFYLVLHSWQHLAMMGLALVSGFVSIYALNAARKQQISHAAYVTIGLFMIYLPVSTLIWSGATLAYALGIFICVNALAQLILLREERLWAFALSLVTAVLPVFFDAIPLPWQRYDVTQWIFSSLVVYTILGMSLGLAIWCLVVAFQSIKTLRVRLSVTLAIGGFLLAVIIGLALIGIGIILSQNRIMGQPLWLFIAICSGVVIVSTLVSVLLGLWVSGDIGKRVDALSTMAKRIGEGEAGLAVSHTREDEIGAFTQAFNSMSAKIKTRVGELEHRAEERARGLRAIAEVSQTLTSELDPEKLIDQVINMIRDQFQLYYVGLFLVEETDEGRFADLRAGTGEAGRQMQAAGWRLPVGGESMVGQCISTGLLRVKQTELDIIPKFANTYLPDTQSELALPLRYGSRIIGAMTIQSDRSSAFDETFIALFRNTADQVAIAIENARLFSETQAAFERMRFIQQRYQGKAWREYLLEQTVQGYEQRDGHISPLGNAQLPEVELAKISEVTLTEGGMLILPILQSGQVVGVLGFEGDEASSGWSEEQIALLKNLAEQLALTAENQRLLDESQKRAAREQLTREITAQLRQRLDVGSVAREAAQALRQALDAGVVTVRLGTTEKLRSMQSGDKET